MRPFSVCKHAHLNAFLWQNFKPGSSIRLKDATKKESRGGTWKFSWISLQQQFYLKFDDVGWSWHRFLKCCGFDSCRRSWDHGCLEDGLGHWKWAWLACRALKQQFFLLSGPDCRPLILQHFTPHAFEIRNVGKSTLYNTLSCSTYCWPFVATVVLKPNQNDVNSGNYSKWNEMNHPEPPFGTEKTCTTLFLLELFFSVRFRWSKKKMYCTNLWASMMFQNLWRR